MGAPAKKAAPKKAPARRSPRAAAKPVDPQPAAEEAELEPGEIRPVVIGKRALDERPVQMVTIFEIDGVPYQIPRNPSAALVLSWMRDVQQSGMKTASANIGFKLLGEKPFAALENAPETRPEDLHGIFENIGIVFFTSENYRQIMAAPDPS